MQVKTITDILDRCRQFARDWLPLDFGFMNGLTPALMAYFLFMFQKRYGIRPFDLSLSSAFFICYSLFTASIAAQLINLASRRLKPLRLVLNILFIVLLVLIHSYHLITHIPLDCGLIIDNFTLGFYRESWYTITGVFPRALFIGIGIFIVILLIVHMRKRILWSPPSYRNGAIKTAVAAALYALVLILPLRTYDEFTGLLRGIVRYPFQDPMSHISVTGYPYLKVFRATQGLQRGAARPNIILVMVESYNAGVIMKKIPDGREITPVFNSLIRGGVYAERFYGNSVQTCKGQAATLLSVIPSIRGKIFTSFPGLSFRALPSILRDAGYETLFLQAADSLSFDNTKAFMRKAGFRDIHSAYEFITDADRGQVWGWGPEDGLFYRICLRRLDAIHDMRGNRPIFATLATTSNHMWFDHVPRDKRQMYPDPRDIAQRYVNSIHLSDKGLLELLKGIAARPWLADTVVIITGDHSFPLDEHGISHNEIGFYEELFRTPFLILWKDRLQPRVINGHFSQLDIAPTVLDLAGISGVKTHFLGQSLFSPGAVPKPVYLIQPYNGQYLGVVAYPFKYVRHTETGKEYLFNLQLDPHEKNNLVGRSSRKVLALLRRGLHDIYVNQKVLTSNRLWPSGDGE
jgi:arylsulfatase A-like enzyme